ncbi:hypothetical protein FBY20_0115 [Achromobacter sp. SLBN-14]|nr:hypothetical protein FBY20_0115 [Achromobacter sp. SLBN-14]
MPFIKLQHTSEPRYTAAGDRVAEQSRSSDLSLFDNPAPAVRPSRQTCLGSLLAAIAHEAGPLSDEEVEIFNLVRDKTPAKPMPIR